MGEYGNSAVMQGLEGEGEVKMRVILGEKKVSE